VPELNADDDPIMKHREQPGPMVKDPREAANVMARLMGRPGPKSGA
jgi:hypothetical protein